MNNGLRTADSEPLDDMCAYLGVGSSGDDCSPWRYYEHPNRRSRLDSPFVDSVDAPYLYNNVRSDVDTRGCVADLASTGPFPSEVVPRRWHATGGYVSDRDVESAARRPIYPKSAVSKSRVSFLVFVTVGVICISCIGTTALGLLAWRAVFPSGVDDRLSSSVSQRGVWTLANSVLNASSA